MHFLKVSIIRYILLFAFFSCSASHAEILSTGWSIEQQASTVTESLPQPIQNDNIALINLLDEGELQLQLTHYGLDPVVAKARIAALTPAERQLLRNHIDNQPAGGSLVGVAAVLFIFLAVTDMLCATDVFSFVNCINK